MFVPERDPPPFMFANARCSIATRFCVTFRVFSYCSLLRAVPVALGDVRNLFNSMGKESDTELFTKGDCPSHDAFPSYYEDNLPLDTTPRLGQKRHCPRPAKLPCQRVRKWMESHSSPSLPVGSQARTNDTASGESCKGFRYLPRAVSVLCFPLVHVVVLYCKRIRN